jgi:hypothetical protein
MLGRALSLAAVLLLIGFFAAPCAFAQVQNLEAGKTPSQLFAGTCNGCHRRPRGLLRTVSPGSLPGFLREHYTTGGEMASQLSAFLISNGAGDTRRQVRQDNDARAGGAPDSADRQGRKLRRTGVQEGARPDAETSSQPGRSIRRQGHPDEAPDSAGPATEVPGSSPAATARGADDRNSSTKRRLGKQGKPGGDEIPAAKDEPPKLVPAEDEKAKSEAARQEDGKSDEARPTGEVKSEPDKLESAKSEVLKSDVLKSDSAKMEMSKPGGGETPVSRMDPAVSGKPAQPAAATAMPNPTGAGESAAIRSPASAASETPATATASEPSAPAPSFRPPVAAAGSPAPPISQ